jgi:hypothetical protein
VRFSIDRRWATLVVAVVLGAGGGSLIGFVTAPAPGDDAQALAPVQEVAPSTTRRKGRFAGVSSTTTRPRPRTLPAATAGLSPGTARTTSTLRPTTTTIAPTTSTTVAPSTTTTTTTGDTTTTTSTGSSTATSTT